MIKLAPERLSLQKPAWLFGMIPPPFISQEIGKFCAIRTYRAIYYRVKVLNQNVGSVTVEFLQKGKRKTDVIPKKDILILRSYQ